ncbi:MAG: hypothetical protein D6704_10545 [Nitrospirae bacterium]|nr:MAG: hypothetical protein D6704_10545 [Nitrospirota bacterium]
MQPVGEGFTPSSVHTTTISLGTCYALFVYDVGAGIDLNEADKRILFTKERGRIRRTRSAPYYFDYHPPPLRIIQDIEQLTITSRSLVPTAELVLYDFGAVSVIFRLPLQGPITELLPLSEVLYENASLLHYSRRLVETLLRTIEGAVEKACVSSFVEDYTIFHIEEFLPALKVNDLLYEHGQEIAQSLRCEHERLSEQEVRDALSQHISFGPDDLTIVDWNAALVVGSEMEDVLAVLEFANVELLERRLLDDQLDTALDEAYDTLSKQPIEFFRWPGSIQAELRRMAQLQVDSAILFERVTNTLKLLGDQYLARLYRLTSQRFHLHAWDTAISRKLHTLDSLATKLAEHTTNRRLEILEWIIILLIALSLLLPWLPGWPQ